VVCSTTKNAYSLLSLMVSTWKRSHARIAWAWVVRNCAQVGPARRGEGSIPAVWRIFHTVEAPIR
jgi:hypothetical protein